MDTAIQPLRIDLYRLRCAVAAIVVAVGHEGLLDVLGYRRIELAVQTLTAAVTHLSCTSAIRRAIERLICPDDDPGGSRTRGAIAELARLTHVDSGSAPGLAAHLLPSLLDPHQDDVFDIDEGDVLDGEEPFDPGGQPVRSGDAGSEEDRPA